MTSRLAVVVLLLLPVLGVADDAPKAKKGYIGVMIALADKDKGGIVIRAVLPKSPAEKAGLEANDVLLKIDGTKPANLQAAVKVIQSLKPGKKVKFEISRDGKVKTIDVTPGELDG
jgi:S1-C subfamily serine protease